MTLNTLYIFVEGETEQAVVKKFLHHYWSKRFTNCEVFNFKGSGNLKARYVRETNRILSHPGHAVLILIDIKNDPFGVTATASTHSEAYEKIQKILYAGLGKGQADELGVFPVVVEVETWLLADPTIQNNHLKRVYTHPENEQNPEEIIKEHIPSYHKGVTAKKYFDLASAVDVYKDNCPHFRYMTDWLEHSSSTRLSSSHSKPSSPEEQQTRQLQERYEALTQKIDKNLKNGHMGPAGVLRTEQKYVEKQINDIWKRSGD